MSGIPDTQGLPGQAAVLYCHCKYAQVVPPAVKAEVLRELCASGLPFEAVPDLCELSARRDPSLRRIAAAGPLKVAACFPRAVKWLFSAAEAPLDIAATEVLNMRQTPVEDLLAALARPGLQPNVPAGKVTASDAPVPAAAPPATPSN